MDGTVGGYYLRPGIGNDASKFKIHLCGGGWCSTQEDCAGRANSTLGSSSYWPPVANTDQKNYPNQWNIGLYGLLGNDTKNVYENWTSVFVMYCDGSSFTSFRQNAVDVNGQLLWHRGRAILDAAIDDLLTVHGMDTATDVILSGTSAGGMATYVHAELFRERVSTAAKLAAVPDAGFWVDAIDLTGVRRMRNLVMAGIDTWYAALLCVFIYLGRVLL